MSNNTTEKVTIIVTKGSFDWAYPPFILASTAAALGKECSLFFTFYGLNLLLKDLSGLKVTPTGNPAMPMKMPMGPKWFQEINFGKYIPNAVLNNMPWMDDFATMMMKKTTKKHGVASIEELRDLCQEADVKLLACQMTVDLFGYHTDDFIDGLDFVGATSYFEEAQDATKTMSLYI